MDVEYQKKEITWCLDREGPNICLRASAVNDRLENLEITCESFKLKLEDTEARDFLEILQRVISREVQPEVSPDIKTPLERIIEQPSLDHTVPIIEEPSIQDHERIDEPVGEPFPPVLEKIETPIERIVEEPVIDSFSPSSEEHVSPITKTMEELAAESSIPVQETPEEIESIDPQAPQITLDTSEILAVLKQSESSVKEVEAASLDIKKMEEEILKKPSETIELYQSDGVETPGISIEDNVKPSSLFKSSVDTVSIFSDSEDTEDKSEKTPLEQLLDESDDQDDKSELSPPTPSFETEDISQETLDRELESLTEELKSYSPSDLESTTFVSDFKSKLVEIESQAEVSEEDSIEPVTEKPFVSETERKSKIEKDRAARKKRLWELTRGY